VKLPTVVDRVTSPSPALISSAATAAEEAAAARLAPLVILTSLPASLVK